MSCKIFKNMSFQKKEKSEVKNEKTNSIIFNDIKCI